MVRRHQIDAREIFVGGINALQIFARHIHEHRQARAVGDEDGVEFCLQFGNRVGAADDDVAFDFHAGFLKPLDFLRDNFFGQAKFRDAINQHAAGFVQRLVNRHVMAALGQFAGGGQPRRAGTDDGHAFAGRLRFVLRQLVAMFPRPVGDVAFQIADAHGQPFGGAHANGFALRFLRANAAGDGGQRVVAQQTLRGLGDFAGGEQIEKLRNVHAHRAALDAARIFALQTAVGLQQAPAVR